METLKRSIWNKTLFFATTVAVVLFPANPIFSQVSYALDASSPTPVATATPIAVSSPVSTPTASASAAPTATPSPTTPAPFNANLYPIDKPDSLWVVVDKRRPLNPINYIPKNLVTPKFEDGSGLNARGLQMAKPAAKAVKLMATAMQLSGSGTLVLSSTYRSYSVQVGVHSKDVAALGLAAGENLAARPGYSEHQTGLAADLSAVGQGCVVQVCFATTKAGKWLAANSWRYGWILRYPKGKTAITGYQFEPWHFRYVGIELSTQMHVTGIAVLESFFGLPAAPSY